MKPYYQDDDVTTYREPLWGIDAPATVPCAAECGVEFYGFYGEPCSAECAEKLEQACLIALPKEEK